MTPAEELCKKYFEIVAAHLNYKGEQYVRELRELQSECIDVRENSDCENRTFDVLEQAIRGQIENTESLISDGIYA